MGKEEEGAKFVRYFGPLLNALRALGSSAKADEAVDRVADDLKLSDDILNGAPPIELIDGEKLLDMLEKLELGLKPVTTYEVEHSFFKEFAA